MSKGLQDYYNTIGGYSSNMDSMNNFLSNYDDSFYDDFNDKVKEAKEQGQALIEAGGAVEGVYLGFKGIQKGVRAWRSKYGKKNDGDEDGQGDDSNGGDADNTNPGGGGDEDVDVDVDEPDVVTPNQGAAGTELDEPEQVTQDPLEFQEDAPVPNQGAAGTELDEPEPEGLEGMFDEDDAGGLFDADPVGSAGPPRAAGQIDDVDDLGGDLLDQGPDLGQMYQGRATLDEAPDLAAAPEAPPPAAVPDAPAPIQPGTAATDTRPGMTEDGMDTYDPDQSLAPDPTPEGGGGGGGGGGGAGGGAADDVAPIVEEQAAGDAEGILTGVLGESGVAALGVAAEAVPILGGVAAIGYGLYELFHHHSKPKPPPAPLTTSSMKGEVVTPSFDSVTDTPANSSAF